MESQVLQTSGLTSWASLKPRCPSHARRPSTALPRLATAQLCHALRSSCLVRVLAAFSDLHQLAVLTPSAREATSWSLLGRAFGTWQSLLADRTSSCRLHPALARACHSPSMQRSAVYSGCRLPQRLGRRCQRLPQQTTLQVLRRSWKRRENAG